MIRCFPFEGPARAAIHHAAGAVRRIVARHTGIGHAASHGAVNAAPKLAPLYGPPAPQTLLTCVREPGGFPAAGPGYPGIAPGAAPGIAPGAGPAPFGRAFTQGGYGVPAAGIVPSGGGGAGLVKAALIAGSIGGFSAIAPAGDTAPVVTPIVIAAPPSTSTPIIVADSPPFMLPPDMQPTPNTPPLMPSGPTPPTIPDTPIMDTPVPVPAPGGLVAGLGFAVTILCRAYTRRKRGRSTTHG